MAECAGPTFGDKRMLIIGNYISPYARKVLLALQIKARELGMVA